MESATRVAPLLLVLLACTGGRGASSAAAPGTPCARTDGRASQAAPEKDTSLSGFKITSIEGRVYTSDGTPASANLVDNAQADFNVPDLRLKISVTVKWPRRERRPANVGLWARENGREVFSQSVQIVPQADSTVHVQDFWIDRTGCKGMLIRAYVWALEPAESEVYRFIPFECPD